MGEVDDVDFSASLDASRLFRRFRSAISAKCAKSPNTLSKVFSTCIGSKSDVKSTLRGNIFGELGAIAMLLVDRQRRLVGESSLG